MTTGTILDRILENKRVEVERRKREEPLASLAGRANAQPAAVDFGRALRGNRVRLIAEVKKASPSRGTLKADLDPASLARTYAENGAAAVSVLTEADHFQGSLEDMVAVKETVRTMGLPVLRKDFLFDPYQVYEARACGADAVLLIVAMLEAPQVRELLDIARECGLHALVEVHSEAELDVALKAGAGIIGVNHRDLHTFEIHMDLAERLRPLAPPEVVFVAESGIGSRADVERMARAGVDSVLVGEALVTAPDTAAKVRELG